MLKYTIYMIMPLYKKPPDIKRPSAKQEILTDKTRKTTLGYRINSNEFKCYVLKEISRISYLRCDFRPVFERRYILACLHDDTAVIDATTLSSKRNLV